MKHLEKLKEALCEELDKFGKSGDITVNSLDKIHRLTDTIKNIDKIMALAVELPTYQRNDLVVYNRKLIDESTINTNPSHTSGVFDKLWLVNYN